MKYIYLVITVSNVSHASYYDSIRDLRDIDEKVIKNNVVKIKGCELPYPLWHNTTHSVYIHTGTFTIIVHII